MSLGRFRLPKPNSHSKGSLSPPPLLCSTDMVTVQCRSKSSLWRGIGLSSCRPVPSLILPPVPTSYREPFLRLLLRRSRQPLQSSLWKFRLPQSSFGSSRFSFDVSLWLVLLVCAVIA